MPLIFMPEDARQLFVKQLSLEIDVTWTKQCLPRLRLPTAKNASNKTLF